MFLCSYDTVVVVNMFSGMTTGGDNSILETMMFMMMGFMNPASTEKK